jgi:hypothetical protein
VVLLGMGSGWLGWKLGVVALHSNDELNTGLTGPVQARGDA